MTLPRRDVADIVAGALKVSREAAYDLMEDALVQRHVARDLKREPDAWEEMQRQKAHYLAEHPQATILPPYEMPDEQRK